MGDLGTFDDIFYMAKRVVGLAIVAAVFWIALKPNKKPKPDKGFEVLPADKDGASKP